MRGGLMHLKLMCCQNLLLQVPRACGRTAER